MSQLKVLSKLHLHDLYSSIQKLRTTKITLYMECHYKNGKCIICVCMYVYIYIYTHTHIYSLSRERPAIVNMTKKIFTASVDPGSQGEWTGVCVPEQ